MKATIYIPEDEAQTYEDAKQKLGESISKTFLRCLERELENQRLRTDRIVVEIYDEKTERHRKKAFEGRFLVGDVNNPEEFRFEEGEALQGGGAYSVALTKANRLAVLSFDRQKEEVISFTVHQDFEEMKGACVDNRYELYPQTLIQAVAAELDIDHIEELDI